MIILLGDLEGGFAIIEGAIGTRIAFALIDCDWIHGCELKGAMQSLSDLTYGAIGILVTLVLVDLGLIHGIFNKNGCLLMTWSAVTAIFTVLQAIGTIWALSISFDLALFLVGIAIILANIRAILTVSMAKKEIDQEKRNAVISIAGQEVASNTQIKCIA